MMLRRTMLKGLAASAAVGLRAAAAAADDVLKMGISIPLTGAGLQRRRPAARGALKLYLQQHGDRGRRAQARTHRARRWRRCRQCAPHRPGDDRQRESGADRYRHHADVAGDRAAGDGSEDSDFGVEFRRLGHGDQVALHGAGRISAKSAGLDHGRMGGQERQQARRHAGQRLGAGDRIGNGVQDPLHAGRRRDYRIDPHSARQSRFCAVLAAHPRPQSGYRLHLFSGYAGEPYLPSNSPSAGSAVPASRSSARATSPTTTVSTPWAIRCSASSRRARIRPLTIPR